MLNIIELDHNSLLLTLHQVMALLALLALLASLDWFLQDLRLFEICLVFEKRKDLLLFVNKTSRVSRVEKTREMMMASIRCQSDLTSFLAKIEL